MRGSLIPQHSLVLLHANKCRAITLHTLAPHPLVANTVAHMWPPTWTTLSIQHRNAACTGAMTMQAGSWPPQYEPPPSITKHELLQQQKAAEAAGYLDPLQHMRMRLLSASNSGDQGASTTVAASPVSRGFTSDDDAAAQQGARGFFGIVRKHGC